MVRTAEKVETLVEEDESFADALGAIKRAADENGGEVEWTDVERDVTSGQWGRLIEKGVLRSSDGGFEFSDPDGVEEVIDENGDISLPDEESPEVEEESSWTQWDKMAGVATVAMMVGYYFNPVRDLIGGTINVFLGPIDAVLCGDPDRRDADRDVLDDPAGKPDGHGQDVEVSGPDAGSTGSPRRGQRAR